MELHLRPCTPDDLNKLVELSRKTFAHAFREQNNPADFEHYLETAFHPRQLLSELKDANSTYYFVFDHTILIGYFKINQGAAQTDLKEVNGLELERIYVLDTYQGKHIGSWMLKQIAALARNRQKAYIWLGVWEYNTHAIRFYEREGFIKFGTHPYYIGRDKQTDWLMRLNLGNLGTEETL